MSGYEEAALDYLGQLRAAESRIAELEAQLAQAEADAVAQISDFARRSGDDLNYWQQRAEQAEAQCAAMASIGWVQGLEAEWDETTANLPAAAARLLAAQELAEVLQADWGNWSHDAAQAFERWKALG